MTNTQEWWERFWSERIPKDVTTNKEPETWYDLVWQVAFDYWYELFEKLAPGRKMLPRSEEHTSELQSRLHLVFPLLL